MQKTSFSIWHNSKKDEYAGHSDFGSHIKEISCEFFPSDIHQPSVRGKGELVKSRKIVIKIEYVD